MCEMGLLKFDLGMFGFAQTPASFRGLHRHLNSRLVGECADVPLKFLYKPVIIEKISVCPDKRLFAREIRERSGVDRWNVQHLGHTRLPPKLLSPLGRHPRLNDTLFLCRPKVNGTRMVAPISFQKNFRSCCAFSDDSLIARNFTSRGRCSPPK